MCGGCEKSRQSPQYTHTRRDTSALAAAQNACSVTSVPNRVRAGIFSLTPPVAPDDSGYLQWHLLDHMPEQYQLPGIILGSRWIADDAHRDARIAAHGPLGDIGSVVSYLVGDPVGRTVEDFIELGHALREAGRYPVARPSLQISVLRLLDYQACPHALISAQVVPFRPHRGVLLIVEEPADRRPDAWLQWLRADHYPAVLATAGTAGAWTFGTSRAIASSSPAWRTDFQYITVVYLDGDTLATTRELTPLIQKRWETGAVRPLFAGPLKSMIAWEAWP